MSVALCRTCLTEGATKCIRNTQFEQLYEKLSSTKLVPEDGRPESVCSICYSLLQQCHSFSIMSQKANHMLSQFYGDGIEISSDAVAALHHTRDTLESSKPAMDCYSIRDIPPLQELPIHVDVPVKEELDSVKVESIQFKASHLKEDIKIEDINCNTKCTPRPSTNLPKKSVKQLKKENKTLLPRKSVDTHSIKEKPYTCDMCHKTYAFKTNLKSHIKTHLLKSAACNTCSKRFPNRYELKRHIRTHTGERPYACNQCHKTYSDSGNLKKHKLTHSGEKSYVCTDCSSSFTLQGNLRRHYKKYHIGGKPVSRLHACESCGKQFRQELQLDAHLRSHTGEKPYACSECDKSFAHETYLRAHVKTHSREKLSACDRCGKTFLDKYRLKRHMKSHTGEKPFACGQCDKTYTDSGNLKKHIMDHAGENLYVCTECNASFTRKGSLQRHMMCHTGEKPFTCGICQKSMSTSTHLKRHIRIHTGEKPYACNVCRKAYADKDDCKRHMQIHTGEKPYTCVVCDYKSFFKKALKLHVASKHPPR